MNKQQSKFRLALNAVFVLTALVMIVDFVLPGRSITDEIIEVKRERQQYYNAARNHHYSYTVVTSEHHFSVGESFAQSVQTHEKIDYSVSRVFKEVNWYRLTALGDKAVYSLRIVSGLVLPVLSIISILVAYRTKWNIGIVVFVLQALLAANLVFLLG